MRKAPVIALLLTAAVACGPAGRANEPPAAPEPSPSVGRVVDPREGGLEVGFGEWAIQLEAPEIRPGPVTFVIRNGGTMMHGFEIAGEDGSGNELKLEANEFGAGETVRVEANLPPGVYKIECFVGDHSDRGMETMLVVRDDAPLVRETAGAGNEVRLYGFAFEPTRLDVEVGTTVTWTNHDPETHTVSADGGAFDSGPLEPGAAFSTRFSEPGRFAYICQIHPTMAGQITVG